MSIKITETDFASLLEINNTLLKLVEDAKKSIPVFIDQLADKVNELQLKYQKDFEMDPSIDLEVFDIVIKSADEKVKTINDQMNLIKSEKIQKVMFSQFDEKFSKAANSTEPHRYLVMKNIFIELSQLDDSKFSPELTALKRNVEQEIEKSEAKQMELPTPQTDTNSGLVVPFKIQIPNINPQLIKSAAPKDDYLILSNNRHTNQPKQLYNLLHDDTKMLISITALKEVGLSDETEATKELLETGMALFCDSTSSQEISSIIDKVIGQIRPKESPSNFQTPPAKITPIPENRFDIDRVKESYKLMAELSEVANIREIEGQLSEAEKDPFYYQLGLPFSDPKADKKEDIERRGMRRFLGTISIEDCKTALEKALEILNTSNSDKK